MKWVKEVIVRMYFGMVGHFANTGVCYEYTYMPWGKWALHSFVSLYIVCVSLMHIISIDKHECSCRTNAMYWPEFSNDALKSLNVRALNRENVLSVFTYSFISQACSSTGQGTEVNHSETFPGFSEVVF